MAAAAAAVACEDRARIGPNAVIQLAEALAARGRSDLARRVFAAAGRGAWLDAPPNGMLPEAGVAAVHAALWRLAPAGEAEAIAADAGRRTADYVIANRIPRPARILMQALPPRPAEALLLKAISRHAWTFAGSGEFRVTGSRPARFAIAGNPLAAGRGGPARCVWHEAVFARLWRRFVDPRAEVAEVECCGSGAPACRFAVESPRSGG